MKSHAAETAKLLVNTNSPSLCGGWAWHITQDLAHHFGDDAPAFFLTCEGYTCVLLFIFWSSTTTIDASWVKLKERWKRMNEPGGYEWLQGEGERGSFFFIDECGHPTPGYLRIRTVWQEIKLQKLKKDHRATHLHAHFFFCSTHMHTNAHIVMMILWPWRHQRYCVTQVAVDGVVEGWTDEEASHFHLDINEQSCAWSVFL